MLDEIINYVQSLQNQVEVKKIFSPAQKYLFNFFFMSKKYENKLRLVFLSNIYFFSSYP